jgi:hypothetical protein
MEVEEVIEAIREYHLFLVWDEWLLIDLWTNGRKMPLSLRRGVYTHREQLAALMRAADSRVCPSPKLHKRSWRRSGPGRLVCQVCHRIDECHSTNELAAS